MFANDRRLSEALDRYLTTEPEPEFTLNGGESEPCETCGGGGVVALDNATEGSCPDCTPAAPERGDIEPPDDEMFALRLA